MKRLTNPETGIGVGPAIEMDGRKIHLMPWSIDDFAMARAHLRSVLPDPFEGLQEQIKDLHPEVQKAIGLKAYDDRRRLGELNTPAGREYFQSTPGFAFFLWRSAVKTVPDLTYDRMLAWVKEKEAEVVGYVSRLMEDLQEATGLSPEDEEAAAKNSRRPRVQKGKRPTRSTGSGSSGPSPNDTHGRRRKLFAGLRTGS